jgi:ubiquinone/menaquinone biosynthesis C-methylase UbiE
LAVPVNAYRPRPFDNQHGRRTADVMRMTGIEKRFVNDVGHSRRVAEDALRRLRHLPVHRCWSYLDVGCGNGAAARRVADALGLRVVGVDVDPQQIALAGTAAGDRTDVRFVTADATCLPFEEGRFDVVATSKTTHHVPRWSSALAEMRRVLKPHGYFVYADLKAPAWLAWLLEPLAGRAGVFTAADLDRCLASLRPVHRHTGWLHYEAILQKP